MSTSLFYYEPLYGFDRFFDEAFSRVNNSTSNSGQISRLLENNGDGAIRSLKPRMDLHEDTKSNSVTATFELPGFKKEDVQVDIQNGRLTISAESSISNEHEQGGYAVRERHFGKFSRTLQLPSGVQDHEIKASMENGVLTVTFPKSAAELALKKITIS